MDQNIKIGTYVDKYLYAEFRQISSYHDILITMYILYSESKIYPRIYNESK